MAKVLVIDDEPEARVLLDIHLRHRGYDVILAGDGWKGLQLYHQEHPDVILLDKDTRCRSQTAGDYIDGRQ